MARIWLVGSGMMKWESVKGSGKGRSWKSRRMESAGAIGMCRIRLTSSLSWTQEVSIWSKSEGWWISSRWWCTSAFIAAAANRSCSWALVSKSQERRRWWAARRALINFWILNLICSQTWGPGSPASWCQARHSYPSSDVHSVWYEEHVLFVSNKIYYWIYKCTTSHHYTNIIKQFN